MFLKKDYIIFLYGCHDNTEIRVKLRKREFNFLRKLSEVSKINSKTDCQPTLEIKKGAE